MDLSASANGSHRSLTCMLVTVDLQRLEGGRLVQGLLACAGATATLVVRADGTSRRPDRSTPADDRGVWSDGTPGKMSWLRWTAAMHVPLAWTVRERDRHSGSGAGDSNEPYHGPCQR